MRHLLLDIGPEHGFAVRLDGEEEDMSSLGAYSKAAAIFESDHLGIESELAFHESRHNTPNEYSESATKKIRLAT